MAGYNSAEIRTKNVDEKKVALQAKQYVADLILDEIVVAELGDFDKYGRVLVNFPNINLCERMIAGGYGAAYTGKGEKKY